MEIPHIVFTKFRDWNKPPMDKDARYDKRFVFALLLALTEEQQLRDNAIPDEVLNFIKGIFNALFFYT